MKSAAPKIVLLVVAVTAVGLGAASMIPRASAPQSVDYCLASGSKATVVKEWAPHGYLDADDTSTQLQHLIDSASSDGGAIVTLPAGTFTLNRPLILKSNVALKGAGASTVVKAGPDFLKSKGPFGGHPLITTNGAQNVTISQLTADQSGDELDGNSSGRLSEYLVDVRNSSNAVIDSIRTRNPFTYSIAVVSSSNFCLRNNDTLVTSSGKYDQLDGIHITDSHDGTVEGNTVDQRQGADGDDGLVAQTIGSPVYAVTYKNNKVRGGSHGSGMQLAVGQHEIHDITIEGNQFWGSPDGIVTGYYGGNAPVYDVAVRNNTFSGIPGPWINFNGGLRNITITNNNTCKVGPKQLSSAPGNVDSNNQERC
ncbi:glycosyl hydrolase family 28-related protein [Arthrobacter sp. fls2-241-R2A-200]|uniref:glycosyl hydrolase family 28-related protein n=1 Tax=Arthrobacter sp. fls2-241-R2A-200 TaxID=3040281 RepID=UPI00254E1130|nr:glycosyl hydrolase family 28-related protein [Arthrobacter sp. fls2-241-R2A-200]